MILKLPFPEFHELVQEPLAASDERSFLLIKRCLIEDHSSAKKPFTVIIQKLTGKVLSNSEALSCWKQILRHKKAMEHKLERTVGIQAAAIDFFERRSPSEILFQLPIHQADPLFSSGTEQSESPYRQGYHLEKLKEELLRAKRYKHALSVIMLDLDNFQAIQEKLGPKNSDKVLATIVRIIKKTIRSVDFLCRLSDERFFLILPNTNRREAQELAERIRVQIFERTGRINLLPEGVTATLSVGQYSHNSSSIEFMRSVERLLDKRCSDGNSVFSLS